MRRLAPIAISMILLTWGCATTDLAPVRPGEYQKEKDEKGLWEQSELIAARIRSSDMVYRDENLAAYINSVARGLFPDEMYRQIPFEVTVIQDPRLNAFALPNGDLFLHTGILARMENEAQLATLLGHEMTHSTHRHSVRSLRDLKNKSAFFSIAILGGGDYGSLLGNLGFLASVSGYSKDLEREADEEGFAVMVEAGYDASEAPRLFEHLNEDILKEGGKEPFFFGTHPRLQERIDNYTGFIAGQKGAAGDRRNAPEFLQRITTLIYDNASLDLHAGRFATARDGAGRYIRLRPDAPEGYWLDGEIHRQKDPEKGSGPAMEAYGKALERDPDFAPAHRGVGILAFKAGEDGRAAEHLRRYIELSPEAPDRGYMEQYIEQIEERGGGK